MPRKVKSTLVDHHFPRFYACYLLKSIRTPRATATYIGSTPSPPRRIRQHNGEITQGAWKTKHNRPWVMQMIVYGFPSKLTALQFEWAWQHPHISRHLRGEDGKAVFQMNGKSRYLRTNVSIARSMICSHPYNTWPLHVKFFTTEAEKAWNDSARDSGNSALPQGFSCTLELEGVDGKSGDVGTGRKGPMDVNDTAFISEHLNKWTALLGSGKQLKCSVCGEPMTRQHIDPLNVALCPTPSCTATSHLSCLCSDFLKHEHASSEGPAIIPRGGECRSCQTYVLWGDIVRGCYRRRGDDAAAPESDGDGDHDEEDLRLLESAEDVQPPPRPSSSKIKPKASKRPARTAAVAAAGDSSEGEVFDLDNVSGSSEEDAAEGRLTASSSRRAKSSTKAKTAPTRRTVQERPHPRGIARNSGTAGGRAEGSLPPGHILKAPLHASRPARESHSARTSELPRRTNAATEYDEGLSPSPSRRALPASLPSYVEISDSESDFIAASPHVLPVAAPSPHAQLSLFADDPGPGSLQRRLSRALSSLSLSSGSELPSTACILRDLRGRGGDRDRDRDHDRGGSTDTEGGDVIEVSD